MRRKYVRISAVPILFLRKAPEKGPAGPRVPVWLPEGRRRRVPVVERVPELRASPERGPV